MREAASQRLDDLLFAQASEGISDAEARELEGLLAAHPKVDARGYERAAGRSLALLGARSLECSASASSAALRRGA
jgi:hypothetical protein